MSDKRNIRFSVDGLPPPMKPAHGDKSIDELCRIVEEADVETSFGIQQKFDGISARVFKHKLYSASGHVLANKNLQEKFSEVPDGLAGEICGVITDKYHTDFMPLHETSGLCRSIRGDANKLHFFVYDDFSPDVFGEPYDNRCFSISQKINSLYIPNVHSVYTRLIDGDDLRSQFEQAEQDCVDENREGFIIRNLNEPYIFGRCGKNDTALMRHKLWTDFEGIVIGVERLYRSKSERTSSPYGYAQRSTSEEDREPTDMLGAFVCHDAKTGLQFRCGCGFTDAMRKKYWSLRDEITEAHPIIMCKRQKNSGQEGIRHCTFRSFRSRIPGMDK